MKWNYEFHAEGLLVDDIGLGANGGGGDDFLKYYSYRCFKVIMLIFRWGSDCVVASVCSCSVCCFSDCWCVDCCCIAGFPSFTMGGQDANDGCGDDVDGDCGDIGDDDEAVVVDDDVAAVGVVFVVVAAGGSGIKSMGGGGKIGGGGGGNSIIAFLFSGGSIGEIDAVKGTEGSETNGDDVTVTSADVAVAWRCDVLLEVANAR